MNLRPAKKPDQEAVWQIFRAVIAPGDTYAFDQTRTSVGIAVSYVSPFGPLRISFAQPVKTGPGDKLQKIQFQFGQQF